MRLHQLGRLVAVVVLVRGAIGAPALGEHQNVLAEASRVRVDGYWLEVDVRVVAGGLACRRAVEVPDGQIIGLVPRLLLGEGLRKKPRLETGAQSRVMGAFARRAYSRLGPGATL